MKTILRSVAVLIATTFTFNASAQIPDNGVWPEGVTFTDINGTVHDVDAILDSGKSIIIDAFADWCGPCWTYHQGHALEDLYTAYGPSGTDELVVLGIEADPQEPESNISDPNTGQGDWTDGVSYPQADDDNIAGIINLAYYPTVIMVCPDRSVTEVGQQSTSVLYSATQGCEGPASNTNDPRLILHESQEYFCEGETAQMSVVLQNFGTDPLTSATIEVFDGATSVATENWTGNLDSYEYETVSLGSVSPSAATTYEIRITSTNDDLTNDELSASVSPATQLLVGQTSSSVTFELEVDDYASEVGIIFNEGALPADDYPTIHNNAASNPGSVLGFSQVGTYSDGTNSIQETWDVNNEGCHYAVFVDQYGDGYNYQTPGASIDIKGTGTSSISVDPDMGDGTHVVFDVKFEDDASLSENETLTNLNVYPNPASENVTVDFETQNASEATVSVINSVGQEVYSNNLGVVSGQQSTQINVANMEAGMYFVKLNTENGEKVTRISVTK